MSYLHPVLNEPYTNARLNVKTTIATPIQKRIPQSLSLRVNFSWTLAGNIIYSGCQWAMLIALARLGRAEMVGQFAFALAITAPILMCTNLNLRSVQATGARREYSFGEYFGLRLMTTLAALLVIIAIACIPGFAPSTTKVILIVGVAKCIESLSDVFYGHLQQNEQMQRIAISMIAKGVLSLLALTVTLLLVHHLTSALLAVCAVWLLVLLCHDLPNGLRLVANQESGEKSALIRFRKQRVARREFWKYSQSAARQLAWLSAPMGLVMFLISLNSNVPRYFIEHQMGLRELGIFAAIGYLITAGSTVIAALGQSATPRLAHLYAYGQVREFLVLIGKLILAATLLGAGAWLVALLAGKPLLKVLYGPEYMRYAPVFTWLMVAAWLGYIGAILGYTMSAARRFRIQAPLYLITAVTTLLCCWLLIPRLGMEGAARAMGLGTLVQLAGGAIVVLHAVLCPAHPFAPSNNGIRSVSLHRHADFFQRVAS